MHIGVYGGQATHHFFSLPPVNDRFVSSYSRLTTIDTEERTHMKVAKWTLVTLSMIAIMWLVASWVNVVAHNSSDYCYAWWNAFVWFCKLG